MLSFLRLLLIPLIVWLYVYRQNYLWTTVILILSGLTDIVDGIIARKCNMVSDFGKAFDPVADKLTQIAVLFCLITRFPRMLLPLIILVIKECFAAVTGLLVISKTKCVMGALWHGKAATVSLYTMMLLHIIWFQIPCLISDILIGLCTGMVLLSSILYSIRNLRVLFSKEKLYE